jgi:hypothetical protein
MRKQTITVCIILFTISVHSQKWENLLGISGRNNMSGKILEHYDRGYLITGTLGTGIGAGVFEGWL